MAKAIYKMRQSNIIVKPPSINKSNMEFTPEEETNSILFGLAGIAGINVNIAQQIIDNRPYVSFTDFFNKNNFSGSLVTNNKFIQLIKAGCFDELEPDRIKVMKQYVVLSTPAKKTLTLANIPEIFSIKGLGDNIPQELYEPYRMYKEICSSEFLYGKHPNFKSKKLYIVDESHLDFFNKHLRNSLRMGQDWFEGYEGSNYIIVVDKAIEKALRPCIDGLKQFIASPDFVKEYNKKKYLTVFRDIVKTSNVNHWSLETCSYYAYDHELQCVPKEEYNVQAFDELPKDPIFITKSYRNREWKQYNLSRIMGAVIDRNDSHHTITLLDVNCNVVQVKFNSFDYAFYKQQISEDGKVVDKSWFTRGNLLIVTGIRMGENDFRIKLYKSSVFQNKVEKINSLDPKTGLLYIQSKRYGQDENEEEII